MPVGRDEKKTVGIAWEADPGIDTSVEGAGYLVYIDEDDDPSFLDEVALGERDHDHFTVETFYRFPEDHPDRADIAIVSTDGDGRFSAPFSPAEWQDIPLSRPALAGPSRGRVITADMPEARNLLGVGG